MTLVNLKEMLAEARKKRYGVPSLLAGNLEMVIGQIMAAEAQRAPLILAFNQEVTPKVPIELGMPLAVDAAKKAKVPVATILDHGQSLEDVLKAIYLGTSAVMFDGSSLPYEENVRQTKEIVRVAHAVGVCVEAELGSIAGSVVELGSIAGSAVDSEESGPESCFTDPELAVEFVERTGVDVLAISFGNVHGVYKGEPNLDLDRVRKIHAMTDIPLTMHGGSGLAESDYRKIVESGISKVGYYTAMGIGASNHLGRMMADAGQNAVVYHDIISWTIDYFYAETKKLLDILGCSGAVK